MYKKIGKRLLDLAIAVPALLLLSPLMAVIAILIRLKLGSPVLFRQQRPGFKNEPFILLKFRTMLPERNARDELLSESERLTGFGRMLRKTSLDELPELFNIIKGEMSLVGPRPLLMRYLERYTPVQKRRHEVKPGLTGLAQVNGRNAISWEQKFTLDIYYVDNLSVWLDFKIFTKTLQVMVKRDGIDHSTDVSMPEFLGVKKSVKHS